MLASVLFLRLHGLAAQPQAEQQRLRDQLLAAGRTAAAAWPDDARVVLDAAEGLAIVGLGDPGLAMQAARRAAGPALAIGLHQGEVAASQDDQGARLQGEGLAGAALAAGRAAAGAIESTRAFEDALAASRSQARRRWLLGATALAGIVGVGAVVRLVRNQLEAARRPAVLVLDIRPSGEVLVDGELKGTSPPLTRLPLAPGPHSIEIRHGRSRPLKLDVQLQPGEEMQVRHQFASPSPPRARPGLLDRLRSWL